MECNSLIDSTINSLDIKQLESEETINSEISIDNVIDNSSKMNIVSNYSQSTAKFMQEVKKLLYIVF